MSYKRDYLRGKEDAQGDLERGELNFKTAGRQGSYAGHWNRILQERFDIQLVWAVGCTASEEEFGYVRGYNEIASQAIQERFGINILEETRAEAMKAYAIEPFNEDSMPEMESSVDCFETVTCAYCGDRFNVTETKSWDGHTHKECGYKLRLYTVGSEDAL
jgi:hypothetical protein